MSAFSFAEKDTTIIRIDKIKSEKKRAEQYVKAAQHAWQTGEFYKTLEYTSLGLEICKSKTFPTIESQLLNERGIAYDYLGDYPAALKNFFKALRIQEKEDYPNLKAYIMSNIGLIYSNQEKTELALEYHNKSLKIRKQINDLSGVSGSLNNIAIVYVILKDYPAALENYLECIRYDKKVGDQIGLGDDYNNIGLCYLEMKEYDKAEAYFFDALKIRKSFDNPLYLAQCYGNIGVLFYNSGRFIESRDYFNQCIEIGKEIGAKELLKMSYETMVKLETEMNNSDAAFQYYKLFILYRDSIDNSENTRLQTELELNYKFEKEKEAERLIREKKEAQAKIILYSVSIGLFLIIIFSTLLFRRWKQTTSQKKIIEEKNKLVELKNEEILDSINYAKRIQTAILPSNELFNELLPSHFVIYLPKDIVAGDFYWLEESNDEIFFAVADCTGHGVPGAMMSVVCHNALNRSVREFGLKEPGQILDNTRQLIVSELSKNDQSVTDGMDISLCIFDKKSKAVYWAGANNPLWIYRNETKVFDELRPNKQPIGVYDNYIPFTTHKVELNKKDRVYLFTDGFADQFGGEKGKKMMKRGFQEYLKETSSMSLKEQKDALEKFYYKWKGDLDQVDDVCLGCILIE